MGQTYSVILKTGFKDKKGAKKALLDRIAKGDEDHTDYNLDHYRQIGIGTDTIEDLMKIFFGGWQGKLVPVKNHPNTLRSDFDACYGWEYIMTVAFNDLAPFLSDGSRITIYPDSGKDIGIVRNGKVQWT
jgi:hypothetical protein